MQTRRINNVHLDSWGCRFVRWGVRWRCSRAILVAHPYAEVGISDDFSYIRIAQVLAQTGHIVYTGWVTPILGWQLYLAAIFINSFGFSFTTTRASIMFVLW